MISRIEAYRYRCFSKLAVEPGAYNVLAGANGSGKTMLLDIPVMLGDLLTERVCSAAFLESQPSRGSPRAHTLTELIHQDRGDDFVLVVEARLPQDVVRVLVDAAAASTKADATLWRNSLRYEVRFQVFNQVELYVLNEVSVHGGYLHTLFYIKALPEFRGTKWNVSHFGSPLESVS